MTIVSTPCGGIAGGSARRAAAGLAFALAAPLLASFAGPAWAQSATISSTTPSALTEANLDGATLTVDLTGVAFGSVEQLSFFAFTPAVPNLTIASVDGFTTGSTRVTLTLAFDGDLAADTDVAVTVNRDAHTGSSDLTTGTVTVTALDAATISSTTPSALTGATLDGATLDVALTAAVYEAAPGVADFGLETAMSGVSIAGVSRVDDATARLTLAYDGDVAAGGSVAVTVKASAHSGAADLVTAAVEVEAVEAVEAAADFSPREHAKAVNGSVLPELARAMWGSALSAATGRLASPGAAAATAASGFEAAASVLRANAGSLEAGSASWKALLGGESFAFRLAGDGAVGGLAPAVVWGSGDWRRLSRGDGSLDWSGDLFAGHVGADMGLGPALRAGLALSRFSGDVGYTDRSGGSSVKGSHDSRMTLVTPYAGWDAGGGTRLWGAAGVGRGEIELADDAALVGGQSAKSRFAAGAAGGSTRLRDIGAWSVEAKASAEATRYEAKDNGAALAGVTVSTRRVRLAASGSRVYALTGGSALTPAVELGARWDGGDGATGAGVEAGAGVSWSDPARGLAATARGRGLLVHGEDVDEWGASASLRLAPGSDGLGPSFSLSPSWGAVSGGATRLWERGVTGAAGEARSSARVAGELGYGFSALGGVLAPRVGMSLSPGGGREARVGARLDLGSGFGLDLTARRDVANGDAGAGLTLDARW